LLAATSWYPIGPNEVRPPEAVFFVRMDYRPCQVRRADEKLRIAERPERDQWTAAFIGCDRLPVHTHGQSGDTRRERDDSVVAAPLGPIFMFGPRPVSEPRPALECLAVHLPPGDLGLDPLPIGQPTPLDARSAEVFLQRFIMRLGEGSSSNIMTNAPSPRRQSFRVYACRASASFGREIRRLSLALMSLWVPSPHVLGIYQINQIPRGIRMINITALAMRAPAMRSHHRPSALSKKSGGQMRRDCRS
jgi:hypothetical protein